MTGCLRLGVIGLGRAFTLMLPTLVDHPGVRLVAASDPRRDALDRFAQDFGANVYATPEELCADPAVQAIYVASPHAFHADHVRMAAANRKHVLVEKPMALTIADCEAMIAAADSAGIHLLVGHSHSFDLPYLRTRELVKSGVHGNVRMINAMNFTDFLYRPRRPEELDTGAGGGVVFSQAAHQVDIVRLLAGKRALTVRAHTGSWDPARPTEGAYSAQITFEGGAFAALIYSGYGRFDTDEFNNWTGEFGQKRDPSIYGSARALLRQATTVDEEIALKNKRAYGPAGSEAFRGAANLDHNHFGFVVVSCEHADLRPMPNGVMIYADNERHFVAMPPADVPRAEVIDELYAAAIHDRPPLHSGRWGLATLEICLAILASAEQEKQIALVAQI
ncbi:4,5-dihydroxyphthalate dehydrogenase [Rhizobiales bacterium GAS188]|nr:4,5-dihydroxyphthalate dehydrogenase [Rhizobiales bacterium GAS188]